MHCTKCNGTGQYLGNGMQMTDCSNCDGYGKLNPDKLSTAINVTPKVTLLDKRSRHYRDAVKDIMVANPEISRDEAMELFDKAYAKN